MSEANIVAPTGPTVALVHGAFADSSSWNGVVAGLLTAGIPVTSISNPLRGISADAAYVASALAQIPGPVLAVGHSYGGAIITNAALRAGNVVGLVYVSAFAPDQGEKLFDIEAGSTDSVLNTALVELKYPTGEGAATQSEFAIAPDKFHDVFASDVSVEEAAVMAATQRPASVLGFAEPTGEPAWKRLPSWAVVATGDKAAGADVVRRMAQRAGATVTEAEGSHVIMVSQPQIVVDVITKALAALAQAAPAPSGAMS
jgi:pimeloyl-ACP methyl ester carboxylesterase